MAYILVLKHLSVLQNTTKDSIYRGKSKSVKVNEAVTLVKRICPSYQIQW